MHKIHARESHAAMIDDLSEISLRRAHRTGNEQVYCIHPYFSVVRNVFQEVNEVICKKKMDVFSGCQANSQTSSTKTAHSQRHLAEGVAYQSWMLAVSTALTLKKYAKTCLCALATLKLHWVMSLNWAYSCRAWDIVKSRVSCCCGQSGAFATASEIRF